MAALASWFQGRATLRYDCLPSAYDTMILHDQTLGTVYRLDESVKLGAYRRPRYVPGATGMHVCLVVKATSRSLRGRKAGTIGVRNKQRSSHTSGAIQTIHATRLILTYTAPYCASSYEVPTKPPYLRQEALAGHQERTRRHTPFLLLAMNLPPSVVQHPHSCKRASIYERTQPAMTHCRRRG